MAAAIIPVDPFDYVIFGATGDLTMRKLLPALYHRFRDGQIPAEARVIGAARSAHTTESFRAIAAEALSRFVKPATYDRRDRRPLPRAGPLRLRQRRHGRELAEPRRLLRRAARPTACACSTWPPPRACTATPAATSPSAAW